MIKIIVFLFLSTINSNTERCSVQYLSTEQRSVQYLSTEQRSVLRAHAFHISKTDMTFKAQEKSVQITMHLFIDDLEMALDKQGYKKLFIGSEREVAGSNDLIVKYLQNCFKLKLNGKDASYQWVGKEVTSDKQALWVYLEVKNVKDLRNISVENKVMTEVFNDQKNIIQVNVPSKKQGYFLLDKAKTTDSASF